MPKKRIQTTERNGKKYKAGKNYEEKIGKTMKRVRKRKKRMKKRAKRKECKR